MSFLRIDNISKQYQLPTGTHYALNNVSLTIEQGEIMGLLGVNGAGKTTLSSIIATLHPATSGNIFHEGSSIYDHLIAFRSLIGYCPQHPNLNPTLTLQENLIFAGHYYGMNTDQIQTRIKELTAQFDLERYLNAHSTALSGGYKQRFMIARSIIHHPQLVILDEPTVGLDPHVRRNLWSLIKELKNSGVTIIITTHYLDEAEKLSDRVCILDKGHVKLIDTPEKLINDFKQKNLEDVFIALMNNQPE